MTMRRLLPLAVLLFPSAASAQVISEIAGLFNIMVGLMLVFSFLFFFGGFGLWFTRLGTFPTYRDEAIKLMEWGVVVLFVLAVLLFVVQFVQKHAAVAAFLVGIAIVGAVAVLVIKTSETKDPEEKH
jgi:hypothetical protein